MADEVEASNTSKNKPERNEKGQLLPGNTANPNGRPSFSIVSLLKEELQKCPNNTDKTTYAKLLIQRILKMAIQDGDGAMARDIINRVDGMPRGSETYFNFDQRQQKIEIILTDETDKITSSTE